MIQRMTQCNVEADSWFDSTISAFLRCTRPPRNETGFGQDDVAWVHAMRREADRTAPTPVLSSALYRGVHVYDCL